MNRALGILIAASMLLVWNFAGVESISTAQDGIFMSGEASWYSQTDPGVLLTTANMEIFNDRELTCAIWGVPFGTLIRVTNIANGKSVIVRVNDRGPAKRLVRSGRVIDLTKSAFRNLSDIDRGLIKVKLEVVLEGISKGKT